MKYIKHLSTIGALLAAASSSQAVVADFDTAATDYTSNFFFATGAATGWSATGGVNGTGGVIITPLTGNASSTPLRGPQVHTTSVTNVAANGDIYLSTYFHRSTQDNTAAGGQKLFAAGLTTIASGIGVEGGAAIGQMPASHFTFGVGFLTNANTAGDVTGVRWRFFADTGADATAIQVPAANPANFNISDDTWYKLDITFTKSLTVGQWTVSASVNSYGTSGVAAPVAVASISNEPFLNTGVFATAATGVYNATSVFGGLSLSNGINVAGTAIPTINAFDNFSLTTSPIPEPSTYAMIAGLAGLAFGLNRRRRSAV